MLRKFLDKQSKYFKKGGSLEKFHPIYEMIDTFIYSPGESTKGSIHIRDGIDLKRMMTVVVLALVPVTFMALYNTGYQANMALASKGVTALEGWRYFFVNLFGGGINPASFYDNIIHGAVYFFPVYAMTILAGGIWEVIFSVVRKHEINEGFLVTSLLFPLILPPTIPLWQVAVGVSFGTVIGKEVFGGTGMNIVNPALLCRAFLFFAYPAEISGDAVWVAVDGFSQATPLSQAATGGVTALTSMSGAALSLKDAFLGFIPGSMGETSTLAILIGAFILIVTGVGSWRIMLSVALGMTSVILLFNILGNGGNPMLSMPLQWHFVLGGFAFGTVFMATDPVSAAVTNKGKYIYGFLIGSLTGLVRVLNPAFPEGMMLAILFGNVFAPVIDHYVVKSNIKKRRSGYVGR